MNFRARLRTQPPLIFNVVSLIDILLVLVAFLLLTWNPLGRAENTLDVQLPSARSVIEPPGNAQRLVVINVTADGGASVNGRRLDDQALESLLASMMDLTPDQTVLVRGDRRAAYERILTILDTCQSAGISSVGFSAAPAKEQPAKAK